MKRPHRTRRRGAHPDAMQVYFKHLSLLAVPRPPQEHENIANGVVWGNASCRHIAWIIMSFVISHRFKDFDRLIQTCFNVYGSYFSPAMLHARMQAKAARSQPTPGDDQIIAGTGTDPGTPLSSADAPVIPSHDAGSDSGSEWNVRTGETAEATTQTPANASTAGKGGYGGKANVMG